MLENDFYFKTISFLVIEYYLNHFIKKDMLYNYLSYSKEEIESILEDEVSLNKNFGKSILSLIQRHDNEIDAFWHQNNIENPFSYLLKQENEIVSNLDVYKLSLYHQYLKYEGNLQKTACHFGILTSTLFFILLNDDLFNFMKPYFVRKINYLLKKVELKNTKECSKERAKLFVSSFVSSNGNFIATSSKWNLPIAFIRNMMNSENFSMYFTDELEKLRFDTIMQQEKVSDNFISTFAFDFVLRDIPYREFSKMKNIPLSTIHKYFNQDLRKLYPVRYEFVQSISSRRKVVRTEDSPELRSRLAQAFALYQNGLTISEIGASTGNYDNTYHDLVRVKSRLDPEKFLKIASNDFDNC